MKWSCFSDPQRSPSSWLPNKECVFSRARFQLRMLKLRNGGSGVNTIESPQPQEALWQELAYVLVRGALGFDKSVEVFPELHENGTPPEGEERKRLRKRGGSSCGSTKEPRGWRDRRVLNLRCEGKNRGVCCPPFSFMAPRKMFGKSNNHKSPTIPG